MQICIFIFWKAMLQIASQNFPELNALNFFSVTVKDTALPDSQREINLVIFHRNYILIHLNILPYSVWNWEYLKMSTLGTTLMTVSLYVTATCLVKYTSVGKKLRNDQIDFYLKVVWWLQCIFSKCSLSITRKYNWNVPSIILLHKVII